MCVDAYVFTCTPVVKHGYTVDCKEFHAFVVPVKVPVLAPVLPSRPIEGLCCNYSEKTTAAKTKTDRVQRSDLLDSDFLTGTSIWLNPNTGHTCTQPVVKTKQLQGNHADMHIIVSHE